jgi:phosphoribosyl-AMP cyclohydrolase
MVAWMSKESLERTLDTGLCTYWSRSRQKFWVKGETSGHTQTVKRVSIDCDLDTLLIQVDQKGAACHENYRSCFFRDLDRGGLTVNSERVPE